MIMGNVLPDRLVSALSLALYGMFLAIIMPKAREDKHVALVCLVAVAASCLCTYLPVVRDISGGTRIIILTIVLSLIAALIWPVSEESGTEKDRDAAKIKAEESGEEENNA